MKTALLFTLSILAAIAQTPDTYQDAAHRDPSTHGGMPWFYNTSSNWYGRMDVANVGDTYHFGIAGAPYDPITVTRTQNGQPASTLNITCDGNGNWIYDGVIQPNEVGFWTESWNINGNVLPLLEITVYPQFGPPNGQSVFFYNYTSGESSNEQILHVGDQFYIMWCGPANGVVKRRGTWNGAPLMDPAATATTGTGCTSYNGSVQSNEVGYWTEVWTVNGIPSTIYHFSVFPVE